jgi:guanosine-3',5'-bis(diphosphate) 3'-pyrophosphohydrolase
MPAIDRKNPAPLTHHRIPERPKEEGRASNSTTIIRALDDKNPVYIKNAGNAKIELAHCCTPIPGDDIVGYVTKGKGITVHRVNCPNVQKAGSRLISAVEWKKELGISTYPVDIEIYANDRTGLLADLLSCLSSQGVAVNDLKAKVIQATMNDIVDMKIYVSDSKTLDDVFADLKAVKGVYEVNRVIH